jgi:uncharacterized damage-inducible protein DinB
MISANLVNEMFERGWWVIERQTEGISHEQSVLQPPFRGNCMNWVLGHLLFERQLVLGLLGKENVLPDEVLARYAYESEPVTPESEDALNLTELLTKLEDAGKQITDTLNTMDDETWQSEIDDKGTPLWQRLEFIAWHEGYHSGQLEMLRQLAGKDDKVI